METEINDHITAQFYTAQNPAAKLSLNVATWGLYGWMIGLLRIPNNECNINPYPLFSLSFQNKIYFTTCAYCSVGSYKSQQFSYHLKPILCLLLVIQPFVHDPFLHIRGLLSESQGFEWFSTMFPHNLQRSDSCRASNLLAQIEVPASAQYRNRKLPMSIIDLHKCI